MAHTHTGPPGLAPQLAADLWGHVKKETRSPFRGSGRIFGRWQRVLDQHGPPACTGRMPGAARAIACKCRASSEFLRLSLRICKGMAAVCIGLS